MTYVVTGAGSGIGRATTLALVAAGHHVTAVGRRKAPLAALAANTPGRITPLPLDVSDAAAVGEASHRIGGPDGIDGIVINHGICHTMPYDGPHALAVWHQTLRVNLDGAYYVLHALAPRVRDGGRVVMVSSGLGKLGRAGKAAYAASKHGLLGLMRCLAHELAPRQITVNAVCPGWVDTGMAAADLDRSGDGAAARADAEAAIPLRRFVRADEVAGLIGWLCSDAAGVITGQAYNISGGEFGA